METQVRGLRILCYNVAGHWFSRNDPADVLGRVLEIARRAVARRVDVLVLQELYTFSVVGKVFRSKELDAVTKFLSRRGLRLVPANAEARVWGMSSGLCIFTSLPVRTASCRSVRFDQQHRPLLRGVAGLPNKGAQVCTLTWRQPHNDGSDSGETEANDALQLCIVNVHLDWKGLLAAQHLQALRDLVLRVETAHPDAVVVVCGDFNQHVPPHRFVQGFTSLTPATATHCDGATYDHVFVKAPANVFLQLARCAEVVDWAWMGESVSDHFGLLFDMQQRVHPLR